jgi:hypothetical protein
MSIEGEITIKVIINSGVTKETLITSSRPLHIPQLFINQPVQKWVLLVLVLGEFIVHLIMMRFFLIDCA